MATWENRKENAAPLQRGRSTFALECTMSQSEREGIIEGFEQRLSTDDLVPWIRYIRWFQEYCPSDTNGLFLLLERCFRTFSRDETLFKDPGFIRVCCLYADKTREPSQTFQEIYRFGIGHSSAVFWNAWAFIAERSQNFKLAEKIFNKGLQKRAEPVEYLLMRQKRFQRRMSRHFLNSINDSGEEEENPRGELNPLRRDDVVANDRRRRPAGSLSTFNDRSRRPDSRPPITGNGVASFHVYDEQGISNDSISLFDAPIEHVPEREPEVERWKENLAKTERWNDRLHVPTVPQISTSGAFAIHIDERCAEEHAREELERQNRVRQHREARDDRRQGNERKRIVTRAWKNELLVDSHGEEQCFEEARALRGYYRTVGPSPQKCHESDMSMSIEESYLAEEKIGTKTPSLDTGDGNSSSCVNHQDHLEPRGKPVPTPRNTSCDTSSVVDGVPATPTCTINLQLARKEISLLFESPVGVNAGDSFAGGNSFRDPYRSGFQNSVLVEEDEERENKNVASNPDARTDGEPGFHESALRSLTQDDGSSTRCTSRQIGLIGQANPLLGLQEHDIAPNPGFVVFADEEPDPSPFAIFEDASPSNPQRHVNTGSGAAGGMQNSQMGLADPEFGDISRIENEDTAQFMLPK